jgi:hypothetical protein
LIIFHRQLYDYLKERDLLHILSEPGRIWNCDESCFYFSALKGFVVVEKGGTGKVISVGNEKQNLTVLFCVSAEGKAITPFILLPYKSRIPTSIADNIPDCFEYSISTGWMTQQLFLFWIEHVSF